MRARGGGGGGVEDRGKNAIELRVRGNLQAWGAMRQVTHVAQHINLHPSPFTLQPLPFTLQPLPFTHHAPSIRTAFAVPRFTLVACAPRYAVAGVAPHVVARKQ